MATEQLIVDPYEAKQLRDNATFAAVRQVGFDLSDWRAVYIASDWALENIDEVASRRLRVFARELVRYQLKGLVRGLALSTIAHDDILAWELRYRSPEAVAARKTANGIRNKLVSITSRLRSFGRKALTSALERARTCLIDLPPEQWRTEHHAIQALAENALKALAAEPK